MPMEDEAATTADGSANEPKPVTDQPAPVRPSTTTRTPASGVTPSGPRAWLRRIRRSARATPSEPEPFDLDGEGEVRRPTLLNRNPFTLGFMLALGALTGFLLVTELAKITSVIFLVVLALFLALGLNPLVEWLHQRGLRRGLGVALVALVLLGLLALAVWAIVPLASEQVTRLIANAPTLLNQLRDNPQIADLDARFNIINRLTEYVQSFDLTTMFGGLVGAGQALAGALFSMVITVVLTLYFLGSMNSLKEFIYQLAPASGRPRMRYIANEIFSRIGGYLTGLFVIVSCTTLAAFLFMNIVGLGQYSLALGVIVAMCAFIPLIGLTLSMTIVSIVAFAVSPTTGFITLAYFLLYMQFDSYVVQPRVYQRSVKLPGVVAILAAVAGGSLYGLVGAILAVPTAAALMVLYQEVVIPALNRS